jgi:hypothetical protein
MAARPLWCQGCRSRTNLREHQRGGARMETTVLAQQPSGHLSGPFLDRVRRSYKIALGTANARHGKIWDNIDRHRASIHVALLAETDDDLRNIFANPASTDLFYGIDYFWARTGITETIEAPRSRMVKQTGSSSPTRASPAVIAGAPLGSFDDRALADHFNDVARQELFLLAQTLGIYEGDVASFDPEKALRDADRLLNQTIQFPTLFRGAFGLRTTRGIASYPAIQAVYQAWRTLSLLADREEKSIIEIGPGMGRTAYYAYRAGLTNYTTVDLPMGIVAQACFLGAALGPEKIWMAGDDERLAEGRIKLLAAAHQPNQAYGLALNADSITEMPLRAALDYMNWIRRHSRLFLSINHDGNLFTVAQISTKWFTLAERRQYPMADRYMEEIYSPRNFPGRIGWHRIAWHAARIFVLRTFSALRRRMHRAVAVLYKPQ